MDCATSSTRSRGRPATRCSSIPKSAAAPRSPSSACSTSPRKPCPPSRAAATPRDRPGSERGLTPIDVSAAALHQLLQEGLDLLLVELAHLLGVLLVVHLLDHRHDLGLREHAVLVGIAHLHDGVGIDVVAGLGEGGGAESGVHGGRRGFGALVEVSKKYKNPVMVAGTDGVGTKLKLAFRLKKHDTIGIDLVAMSVNDILVSGAEPIFFLDYFACSTLDVGVAADVVKGIAEGCEQANCALIGGETAEMPGMYDPNEYDLAGFAVGLVEKAKIIDGAQIVAGDVVIGLTSSGAHSNGFSLVRKVIAVSGADLYEPFDEKRTLGEALLEPTRIYVKPVLATLAKVAVKGLAHITGGGLTENIPRVLPDNVCARLERGRWKRPAVFDWLQKRGHIEDAEMHRTFNCGIGMVLVVARADLQAALDALAAAGAEALEIGAIVGRQAGEPQTVVV